jgi:hypothetical protein
MLAQMFEAQSEALGLSTVEVLRQADSPAGLHPEGFDEVGADHGP